MKFITRLKRLDACSEAIEWLEEKGIDTIEEAWQRCERGDWMLWLYRRFYPKNKGEILGVVRKIRNT